MKKSFMFVLSVLNLTDPVYQLMLAEQEKARHKEEFELSRRRLMAASQRVQELRTQIYYSEKEPLTSPLSTTFITWVNTVFTAETINAPHLRNQLFNAYLNYDTEARKYCNNQRFMQNIKAYCLEKGYTLNIENGYLNLENTSICHE